MIAEARKGGGGRGDPGAPEGMGGCGAVRPMGGSTGSVVDRLGRACGGFLLTELFSVKLR